MAQKDIAYLGVEALPSASPPSGPDSKPVTTHKYLIHLKFESKSWQYSWKSTRCTKDTDHSFVISVLAPSSSSSSAAASTDSHLRCLSQWCGPPFKVACVRRSDRSRISLKSSSLSSHERTLQQLCRMVRRPPPPLPLSLALPTVPHSRKRHVEEEEDRDRDREEEDRAAEESCEEDEEEEEEIHPTEMECEIGEYSPNLVVAYENIFRGNCRTTDKR